MSLLRAFSSAESGMRTEMSYMDVVANNISNVNTQGFKASRAHFSDLLYQTIASGSASASSSAGGGGGGSSSTGGGIDPTQLGLGAQIGSVDNLMTSGEFTSTSNPLDLAINGSGFFAVKDSSGATYYTRDGDFQIDANNNLVLCRQRHDRAGRFGCQYIDRHDQVLGRSASAPTAPSWAPSLMAPVRPVSPKSAFPHSQMKAGCSVSVRHGT